LLFLRGELRNYAQKDHCSASIGNLLTRTTFSDIIVAQATVNGFEATRDRNGSWFIQAVCRVLNNRELTDVLEIRDLLDEVSRELATFSGRMEDGDPRQVVQSAVYEVIGWRKKLYLPTMTEEADESVAK